MSGKKGRRPGQSSEESLHLKDGEWKRQHERRLRRSGQGNGEDPGECAVKKGVQGRKRQERRPEKDHGASLGFNACGLDRSCLLRGRGRRPTAKMAA